MIKKKSIGLLLLSLYLIIGGILSIVAIDEMLIGRVISASLGIAAVICGIGIFFLKKWSLKATIVLLLLGIVNSFLLSSPIFQEQRIQQLERQYESISKEQSSKYSLNDKEVTKEEFLANRRHKIDTTKKSNFDLMRLLPSILLGATGGT